jgi:hypothetical protein
MLGSVGTMWTSKRFRSVWENLHLIGLFLMGLLLLLEIYVVHSWGVAVALTLLVFLCYKIIFQRYLFFFSRFFFSNPKYLSSGLIVAQSLQQYYALVFTCLQFLGLLVAFIISQSLVALHCSASRWFYLGCVFLGALTVLLLVVVRLIRYCAPQNVIEQPLLEKTH